MFSIVEIDDEGGKSVEVVPDTWLTKPDKNQKVKCYWPPLKNPSKLVTQMRKPDTDWSLYAARVLRKYGTYQKARIALPRAQYTSDWSEIDETPKRKRVSVPRRNVERQPESSDEELIQESCGLKTFPAPPSFVLNVDDDKQDDLENEEDRDLFTIKEVQAASEVVRTEDGSPNPMSSQEKSPEYEDMYQEEDEHFSNPTDVVGLLRKLVLDVAIIRRTVQNIDSRLQNLEKCTASSFGGVPEKEKNLLAQPFATVAEFQEFDESLDKEKQESLKNELLKCGGDTTIEFIGRSLKKLITNEVGLDYSLWGYKNNVNFSKTVVWGVLKEAALSVRRINPTEKAIEKAASEWFRHCGDRIKQSAKRLMKA
ncbi:unnamed protein product [Orchesella dallaii]|uniref:DUF4806 domain-containing protein n=1 Tax=Orchesella dallaii TaxID=48710 RepID=A0ABP1QSF9_9HEXA